ncbi:MAG: ABC transporter ATP-binding protein/permease [Lachnospiraceae bacterium]|nr:ABC transporter ATP-binding protein/permease [Lachnospiraceae bacterium]
MKQLLKYLKNYKKECVIAPAFKMLEAIFELFVPLVMARIIDEGISLLKETGDKSVILKCGALLVLLALIGLTCALIAQYFAAKAAIGFAKGVRGDLFSKILSFSHEVTDKQGTSTLITRMTNDINSVQNGVNMSLRLLLRSPFIVFGAMIMAFTINVKAAIIFTLVIPILFVIVTSITLTTIPKYKAIQKKLDRLTLHVRENLSGARVVRAFDAADEETDEFTKDNNEFYSMNRATAAISALLNPATLIIVNLALMVVIWQGGNLVNDNVLKNGQVIALINYMSQILIELVKLTNLFITINKATASASRIADTLAINNTLEDNGTLNAKEYIDSNEVLSFENVSFTYPGAGAPSLEALSFTVNKGETIGVIGGTGSGKSSLSSLIMRFYDASEGKIKLFGHEICEYSLNSLRSTVSYVPQRAQLFTGTIRNNLTLGASGASDEELWEALRISEGKEVVEKKEEGLDYVLTEAGANLSGGQKQRLTIARAVAEKNPLLILDDSSSALDYATDARLRTNLKALRDRMTLIIISQRVVSVKDADKILVLDDGKMAGFGTHDELLKNCEVYSEIVNSQSGREEEM